MLKCFFDDAGTHSASASLVYGGFAGTEGQWAKFDDQWRRLLARPLPHKTSLRMFHLAACRAADGAFKDYSPAERDAVRFDFRAPIIENNLVGVSYGVPVADYQELITGPMRDWFGSPEQYVLGACIGAALRLAYDFGETEVSVCFDAGRKSVQLEEIVELALTHHTGPVLLRNVEFATVESQPGLQAADIIATEARWQAEEYVAGRDYRPSPHFASLLRGVHAGGHVFDRAKMVEAVARYDREGPWDDPVHDPLSV